jgi:putative endopeptidase
MTRTTSLLLAFVIATLGACRADSGRGITTPATTTDATTSAQHDIDHASMDTSVSPGDGFYHYANGTWLKNTEIPADRASYGVFDILGEQSQQRTDHLASASAKTRPH